MDDTYERILREIRKPNQGHAHRLLQCLVAAARPLQVKELAEVLAFDFDAEGIPKLNLEWRWEEKEEAVMSACSSLVMIVKDKDSWIVQSSHFSVKEFLTANRLVEPIRDVSRYHIRLEAAHMILAQACLGVLLRLDDRVDRDDIKNFPLARYAAQHWPTHARFGSASSRIKNGMECLFDSEKPHFATWLWIYDEDWCRKSMTTTSPGEPRAFPLYYAARLGFRDLAEHLIAKHPEHVNAMGGWEKTPMHVAARLGHADVLSLLLEHGADLEGHAGVLGETPLHLTSSWCRTLEAGQCLLDHGANINARDRYGWTPLHSAVGRENVQAVRFLLEHGADAKARDNKGWNASHATWTPTLRQYESTWQREILELLSEYGVPIQSLYS